MTLFSVGNSKSVNLVLTLKVGINIWSRTVLSDRLNTVLDFILVVLVCSLVKPSCALVWSHYNGSTLGFELVKPWLGIFAGS